MKYLLPLVLTLQSCVVTTLEGPGEPPRVAPRPGRASRDASIAAQSKAPEGPESVAARHILVSYQGATRSSPQVTRSKAEAQTRAQEALQRAQQGEDFAKLVGEFSDEPGAAERGGDLGRFQRGSMVKPFADAAFALRPGELSGLVETPFGYHVIQRTE